MSNTVYNCIIIGGGISGISFAHYLHSTNKNVLILEKNENLGGQIQTAYSDVYDNYWREMGAHTCYNSYTNLLSIVKEIDGGDQIQPLHKFNYVVYATEKIKSIFSQVSILPCILNFPKFFFADKRGKTVREYFRPLCGRSNYDRLFTNAFRAVICQKADNYPAELFLKRRKDRIKELPRRFTFKNGLSSFLKKIVEKDNLNIHSNIEILGIYKDGDIYRIETRKGAYYAKNIAIATNPHEASILLKDIEPAVSALLSTIPMSISESLNITLNSDKLSLKSIAGIISLSDGFMSAVSRDLIPDERLRSFTFHFEKGEKSRQEQVDLICKVLNISESDILEIVSSDHALASVRIEHLKLNEQIEKVRQSDDVYVLGNYYYGLSLEDCVNRSLDESERYNK